MFRSYIVAAYRIDLAVWMFDVAGGVAVSIAWLTVSDRPGHPSLGKTGNVRLLLAPQFRANSRWRLQPPRILCRKSATAALRFYKAVGHRPVVYTAVNG
jgi:hypothetical protein